MKSGDVNKQILSALKGWFKERGFSRLKGSKPKWENTVDRGRIRVNVLNRPNSWDKKAGMGAMNALVFVWVTGSETAVGYYLGALLAPEDRAAFRALQKTCGAARPSFLEIQTEGLPYRGPEDISAWMDIALRTLEEAIEVAVVRSIQIEQIRASEVPVRVPAQGSQTVDLCSGLVDFGRFTQVKTFGVGNAPCWATPDGQFIALIREGRKLQMCSRSTDYEPLWTWEIYPPLMPLAPHPEGDRVAMHNGDALEIFGSTGQSLARRELASDDIPTVSFAPDGLVWLVDRDEDGEPRLFLLDGGTLQTLDSVPLMDDARVLSEGDVLVVAQVMGSQVVCVSPFGIREGKILSHPEVPARELDGAAVYTASPTPSGAGFIAADTHRRLWLWSFPDGEILASTWPLLEQKDGKLLTVVEVGRTERLVYTLVDHTEKQWTHRANFFWGDDLEYTGFRPIWMPHTYRCKAGVGQFLAVTAKGLELIRYVGEEHRCVIEMDRVGEQVGRVMIAQDGNWLDVSHKAVSVRRTYRELEWLRSSGPAHGSRVKVLYSDGEHARFGQIGRCSAGPEGAAQFMAFVTGADPVDPELGRPMYPDPSDPSWADRKRWYAVVHVFDAGGSHLGTAVRCGGTTAMGRDMACTRAARMLDDTLRTLGTLELGDIAIGCFSVERDGYLFGLIDQGETAMLWPNDVMFHAPWDGSFST